MSNREAAAKALLVLIGKGPETTFPFPLEDYDNALAVVDTLRPAVLRPEGDQ